MKCLNCNNFVHDLAVVCPYCGNNFPAKDRDVPKSFVMDRHPQEYACNCGAAYNSHDASNTCECADKNINQLNPSGQQIVSPEQYYQNYYQNIVSNYNKTNKNQDVPKESLEALCAIFPLMGLILYLVNQEKRPNCAKKYGKVALWGLAISGIIYVVSFVLTFLFMFLGMYGLATGFNV